MRIALVSSYVPFVSGAARNIVDWLEAELRRADHLVERVYLPFVDVPDLVFEQMAAFRWVDLSAADRVICFRPPAHAVPHENKIVWFIHHLRTFYDLWDSPFRGVPDNLKYRGLRDALHDADTRYLREAKRIFTNSKVVGDRLQQFNGVQSEVLYPPIHEPDRFRFAGMNDEIVCVCGLEPDKRQRLLVEGLKLTRTPVRLRLCGAGMGAGYPAELRRLIGEAGVADRVVLQDLGISEDDKAEVLSRCLAAAYAPLGEDWYGYASLEASHSKKPILTTADSGGVLELVEDGYNGLVAAADSGAIAEAMDRLYLDREKTRAMGENARARIDELGIKWATVLEKLLS